MQRHIKPLDRVIEGLPLIVLQDGELIEERLAKARVDGGDILEAGRKIHGLERLEQMKYAVFERDGSISIIPRAEAAWRAEIVTRG